MYVDMDRFSGRPLQSDPSSCLWADADGVIYTYHPSPGRHLEADEAELLHLDPLRGDHFLRRRPQWGDFSQALGHAGVDYRVPVDEQNSQEEAILTNWIKPPRHGAKI